jgi:hypothetical protein
MLSKKKSVPDRKRSETAMTTGAETYELFASAHHLHILVLLHVSRFTGLSGVEPTADAQPLAPFGALVHNDLFHGVVAPSRLHFEEDELVPTGRYGPRRCRLRLGRTLDDGVQLEGASVLGLPRLTVRQGHVQDVGNPAGANDIIVIEQITPLVVSVHGHVLLRAGDGPAPGHGAQEGSKPIRVQGVAEGEQAREEGDLILGEVIERSEISGLVDLRGAVGIPDQQRLTT